MWRATIHCHRLHNVSNHSLFLVFSFVHSLFSDTAGTTTASGSASAASASGSGASGGIKGGQAGGALSVRDVSFSALGAVILASAMGAAALFL